jgi:hypothetical protein
MDPGSRLDSPTPPGTRRPVVATTAAEATAARGDHFDRVLIVVLENENFGSVMKDAYFKRLADEGACFTHFRGLAHPSYPNYLAMVAGRLYHTHGDRQQDFADETLADSLTAAGLTWKNYAEGFPGNCFSGTRYRRYARKHVPFMSFVRVRNERCDGVVEGARFQADFAGGTLPSYAFYSPDMDHDAHDTGIAFSSRWLKGFLEPIRRDPDRGRGLLIVVTYDESKNDPPGDPNHIYTVFLGDMIKPGRYDAPYNHFNVLRTIEDNFGLAPLADGDGGAKPVTGVWATPPADGEVK